MNETTDVARQSSRGGAVLGIATLIFGVLCLFAPGISGLSVTLIVAILMLAAGMARLVFAFKEDTFGRGLLTFLLGGLSILCGVVIMARPLLGLASLTMVLAVYFIADGIVEIVMAFKARPAKGWGWMVLSGVSALLLSGMILYDWPVSGVWAIGILVGVRLVMAGWSMIALGAFGEAVVDEAEKATGGGN